MKAVPGNGAKNLFAPKCEVQSFTTAEAVAFKPYKPSIKIASVRSCRAVYSGIDPQGRFKF